MGTFIKYPKVYRLGKDEVEGIMDEPEIYIFEKLDGANASIWTEDGIIELGSRNHNVPDFRGLREYVERHSGILKLLEDFPKYRLFGEWLVKHRIKYNDGAYLKFYIFDILNEDTGEFLSINEVMKIAEDYKIRSPKLFVKLTTLSGVEGSGENVLSYIEREFLGKSEKFFSKINCFLNLFFVRKDVFVYHFLNGFSLFFH
jgi:ATP-dependent RNA circularization protein (DNA/RNA ligase family)